MPEAESIRRERNGVEGTARHLHLHHPRTAKAFLIWPVWVSKSPSFQPSFSLPSEHDLSGKKANLKSIIWVDVHHHVIDRVMMFLA
jgi:hypothetical protein